MLNDMGVLGSTVSVYMHALVSIEVPFEVCTIPLHSVGQLALRPRLLVKSF